MGSRWRQLLQLRRGFRALFPLAPACCLVPRPAKLLHASVVSYRFLGSSNGPARGKQDKGGGRWGTGLGGDQDDEEEGEEEDGELEVEDELLELALPSLPFGVQRVFVVHPAVKWGPGKARLTTAELQLAEAVALINTIQDWTVVDKIILSTKNADQVLIFGKGNFQLLTGMCMPSEHGHFHPGDIEETVLENFDHGTSDSHPKRTTSSSQLHYLKGQEGAVCLRSSDCASGLCCARHFWSKICKPVLQEGQVCTKHRKKGSHGLEIFQRCYCADGLTCRLQKDHSNTSRLHTCQRH